MKAITIEMVLPVSYRYAFYLLPCHIHPLSCAFLIIIDNVVIVHYYYYVMRKLSGQRNFQSTELHCMFLKTSAWSSLVLIPFCLRLSRVTIYCQRLRRLKT